jgi:predicted phosphodiesterase
MNNRVFITGDTHIPIDIHKLTSKQFTQSKNLTKDDYVIILGDFGLLWKHEPDGTEKYWTKWLNDKSWTTLTLDGNHENFDRFNKLPIVGMFGSKVGKVSDSIFYLRRGNIYKIAGKKFLTIGGADSIDKHQRSIGISWWQEELLSYKDINNTLNNIDINNKEIDFILSHTCPTEAYKLLNIDKLKDDDPTMHQLQVIKEELNYFEHWFFGHFHIDQNLNDKFTCLFNNIICID